MSEDNRNATKPVVGATLVVIGILVAIAQMTGFDVGSNLWPLYIIAPGLLLLAYGTRAAGMAKWITVAGSVTTVTGLILAYQNTFSHFESWAYAWSLLTPGAIGLGFLLHARRSGDATLAAQGRQMINIAGAIFLFGAVFFELVINISGRGMPEFFTGSLVLPGILVLVGIAVLVWPRPSDDK